MQPNAGPDRKARPNDRRVPEPIPTDVPEQAAGLEHDPIVVPDHGITNGWLVRCRCGLMETYGDEADALIHADEHAADAAVI